MKQVLIETIQEAGKIALEWFDRRSEIEIQNKGNLKDLVTEADLEIEKFLKQKLLKSSPGFGFLGEESGSVSGESGRWIVDPIDGTHSFARGQYFWSVSVALEKNDKLVMGAVIAPRLGDLYFAELGEQATRNEIPIHISLTPNLAESMVGTGFACLRDNLKENNLPRFNRIAERSMGQRRFGSAALDLCLVADGQLDVFWEQQLNLYDIAAGCVIAKQAGAVITDFKGNSVINPKEILVSNGRIHREVLELM